ncbi:MAG: peptide-methionine (S)-S-oxide reductase MsrA [Vogesella sp.]|uniref:peptide-methionine (S)-S-oxide reductase MsrA n=1 Tax=Vogesella sp. TaxID=1904252 RepID=UPI00391AC3C8
MNTAKATLAGGCFWCTEAVFRQLQGVLDVVPGYIDGHQPDPDYASVCRGDSGHAEAIEITYQPDTVSYDTLLQVFFLTHDPTTLNRQGHDVGSQYRSAIYTHDAGQHTAALACIRKLEADGVYNSPIVTQVKAASVFYPAEAYHHDYFARNQHAGYCQAVIAPKLHKLYSYAPAPLKG